MEKAAALLILAALAGEAPAQAPMQQMPPDVKFALAVADEINAVAAFKPPDFTLSIREDEKSQLAFYGRELHQLEGVRCERHAAFQFVALANLVGHLQVGICASEAKRVRTLAVLAPRSLEALLGQLPEIDVKKRSQMGWTTTRAEGANRTEEHVFPVVAIGHGVLVAQTVVIVSAGGQQAVVVQADTSRLCESYGLQDKTALCRNTRQALTDIARRVQARLAR